MSVAGLLHRRSMMQAAGGTTPVLPAGYTAVSGLRIDPTNRRAVGFSPAKPFVVRMEATILSLTPLSNDYSVLFGRDSNMQLGYTQAGKATNGSSSSSSVIFSVGNRYIIEGCFSTVRADAYYHVDGNDTGLNRASSGNTFHALGGFESNYNPNAILHSLKIYQNSVMTYDYVPCKRDADNVCGLYDLVNDAFLETQLIEA